MLLRRLFGLALDDARPERRGLPPESAGAAERLARVRSGLPAAENADAPEPVYEMLRRRTRAALAPPDESRRNSTLGPAGIGLPGGID